MKIKVLSVLTVLVLLSMVAAQCGAPATPEKIIETVIVEKEVEKIVTQEVEVEKIVTVEVEVEVEVTAEAPPAPSGEFAGRSINFIAIQPHTVASKAVAGWFEEETGARVQVLIVPYGNVTEKEMLDVTSGAGEYDVMEIWYPMLGTLADAGVIQDLTDFWAENAEAMEADDFVASIVDPHTTWDGKRWAVPYDGDVHVLWYNTTLLDKYGQDPPETWDDYLEVCKTITEQGEADGEYGCAIMGAKVPLILIGTYLNRLGGYGGAFFDEEGNPTINSPEAVAALEALLEQLPYALPEPPAVAFDEALGGWLTGNVAMVEFWTDLGQMSDNPEQSKIMGEWGVMALPKGSGDKARHAPAMNAGFSVGVSTMAQDPELALEFLKFITRPDIVLRANTIVGGLDPTRASTYDEPAYREHVTDAVADAAKVALGGATPWPNNPQWAELQDVLNENLAAALVGEKTAQGALDDTQAEWETILAE